MQHMQHSYRDSKGRFAKRPIGVPESVTSQKELESNVLAPIKVYMHFKKNKEERVNQSCPICMKLEQMKKVDEPVSNYGLSPNIKFIDDPTPVLESEMHNGKPHFLKIDKDDIKRIRILEGIARYKQTYVGFEKDPVERVMINVYDHDTGEFKVLSCGKALFKELHEALGTPLLPKKMSLLQSIRKWIDRTIFKKKEPQETFDVVIERREHLRKPRWPDYYVKRIRVENPH
jgi:hypothetical protein